MAKAKEENVVRRIFPGRTIELEEGGVAVVVHVYPPGLVHLEQFSTRVASILGVLANTDLRGLQGGASKVVVGNLLERLGPLILSDLTGLVRECCVVEVEGHPEATLDDLPHWHLAAVVEAWVEESFLEERKWRPWLEALERLISKATGQPFSISEMLSSSSSLPATRMPTSSAENDPGGPIAVGASPSSGSGSESPSG